MLTLPPKNPVNYALCQQTVTVYHKVSDTEYTQTIHPRAFLDFRKNQSVDKTGSKEVNSFLLVIPGNKQAVEVGDKVLLGKGPDITDRKAWADFIPSKVPNLVVVKYVDPKYWGETMVHTEAGG